MSQTQHLLLLYLVLSLGSIEFAIADGAECRGRSFGFDALRSTQAGLSSQTPEFCRRNMYMRFLATKNTGIPDLNLLSTAQLQALSNRHSPRRTPTTIPSPWDLALISTPASRQQSLTVSTANIGGGPSDNPVDGAIEYLGSRSDSGFAQNLDSSLEGLNQQFAASTAANDAMVPIATAGCVHLSNTVRRGSANDCERAMRSIVRRSSPITPYSGASHSIMNPPLWTRVLSSGNVKFEEGLRIAARQSLVRARSNTPPTGDIFSDLKNGFLQSGSAGNIQQAHDQAMQVMGLIATAGSNMLPRLEMLGANTQAADSIKAIAGAMGAVDIQRSQQGQPLYSFPGNVDNDCDNSKSYHFWYSAYLTHELIKEGIPRESAGMAVYAAQLGYQVHRDQGRGDGSGRMETVLSMDDFSPVHNVIRMDLAFAASGTRFAAFPGEANINTNAALTSLVVRADSLSNGTGARNLGETAIGIVARAAGRSQGAETYFNFGRVFAPEAAMQSIWPAR